MKYVLVNKINIKTKYTWNREIIHFFIVNIYAGGRAQSVAVLSADVDKNEKSFGCHLPEITLSWWAATTTLGNGAVKSPENNNVTYRKTHGFYCLLLIKQ